MLKTGIVVVTFNRLNLLKEVVDALRKQTVTSYQIIIVNNGSTDGTSEWLAQQKDIVVITQENVGGAGGFFSGMKYVVEQGYSHCWIMDDDVICEPTALEELHEALLAKKNIGFVCSRVLGIDGCPMNTPEVDCRSTLNGYADYADLVKQQMIKVRSATFVSVLFPCEIIQKMGLPYKEFFIWGDDTEYTLRISNQFDCYMACRSLVVHKRAIQGNLSFENETDSRRLKNYFYKFRNTIFFEFQHRPAYKGWKPRFMYRIRIYWYSLKMLLKGNFDKAWILWRACRAAATFKPQVQYPLVQNKDVR